MSKEIQIGVISIDLMEFQYTNCLNKETDSKKGETERFISIKHSINEKNEISFTVDFSFEEHDFKINGSYLLIIEIENLENLDNIKSLDEFVSEEKKKLVYPVYSKISNLISNYSELVRPFPLVYNPHNWIGD